MDDNLTEFVADILTDDAQGVGRSKLSDELLQMRNTLKQKMDKGVSPEEAKKIQIIKQAIDSSMMIVDKTWDLKYN